MSLNEIAASPSKSAQIFLNSVGELMNQLDALCKKHLTIDPDKVFCFSYDLKDKRWRLFVDYDLLSQVSKKP
jgi:hypothetical protein